MAFFQAKTGWDRLRMREKKNHSYQFLSNLEYKIPKKNSKKIQKIKKHQYCFFSSQNLAKVENVKKKNSHSDPFQPDPKQGIPEKQQKNSKN